MFGRVRHPDFSLYDLRKRRRVKRFEARWSAERILLTARGAVVYAGTDGDVCIYAADARGHRRVACGTPEDLPLTSVRVVGNTLKWRFREAPQSLRLR